MRFKDRLEKEDKLTLYPLTFEIDSYLNKFKLENWEWSDIINNADFSLKWKDKGSIWRRKKFKLKNAI